MDWSQSRGPPGFGARSVQPGRERVNGRVLRLDAVTVRLEGSADLIAVTVLDRDDHALRRRAAVQRRAQLAINFLILLLRRPWRSDKCKHRDQRG